ncbi:MAG: extracellular solute-binding protein, partial [Armatimonadota bacterium]
MPEPSARIFLATVSGNYREGFQRIAREYARLHPGVEVKVQVMPANGYETWLRTQIPGAGDKAPDLFNANYAWGMYEKGLLVNLAPFLNQRNPYTGKAWIQTLNPQFIEKYKTAGGVSFVTVDFVEIGFYYNASLFRRLGLREPSTWEE